MHARYALSITLFLMGTPIICAFIKPKPKPTEKLQLMLQKIRTHHGDAGRALAELVIACVQQEAPHATYIYEDPHAQFTIHHKGAFMYQGSWGGKKKWNLIVHQKLSNAQTTVLQFKPIALKNQ